MGRRYSKEDCEILSFYKMPKSLWGEPNYKGLSIGAKAMYMIMLDRQELSLKNKWVDNKGEVYFFFDCNNISELMEVSTNTINRYKKELQAYKLLQQVRQGQGKANRLYILKPETVGNTKSSEKSISRIAEIATLEKRKSLCSKTELSKTKKSNTEILHHRFPSDDDISSFESVIEVLEAFTSVNFGKSLRANESGYELEDYQYLTEHQFIDFLFENIKTYDHCNVDYLNSIAIRLSQ